MENKGLSKDVKRTVFSEITKSVPESSIGLRPMKNGYTVSVSHNESSEKDGMKSVSAYSYTFERHFERDIKDVKGKFNSDGNYEVTFEYVD
ncbi:hypothetical protein PAEPH01_1242 [Pancytospora epiphaga]|nr:hypothetical protein PAEPH01_1242 [Pancytospora epiphaga]